MKRLRTIGLASAVLLVISTNFALGSVAQSATKPRDSFSITPINAEFISGRYQTIYDTNPRSASVMASEGYTIKWTLTLTLVDNAGTPDPGILGSGAAVDVRCNNNGVGIPHPDVGHTVLKYFRVYGSFKAFVWHHPDPVNSNPPGVYHCNHLDMGPHGHQGLITVVVSVKDWECTATYKGTNSSIPSKINQIDPNVKNGTASKPKCSKVG